MKQATQICIIGAGPAGLMAAQCLAEAGHKVTVYDRMPSAGRKFLMAGRGGLNLTHSEALPDFIARYGKAAPWLAPHIKHFNPDSLRAWCEKLGRPTFVGSSGRVFPEDFKASPLLRAWLRHLDKIGVTFCFNHRWDGWNNKNELLFTNKEQDVITVSPHATLLALGGASWPRLGSDGAWVSALSGAGVGISPLRPANCGFVVKWSDIFRQRCAGQPIKSLRISFAGHSVRGEAMVTEAGIEGGVIYALSSVLRESIAENGKATIRLDLRPDLSLEQLTKKLEIPQGRQSRSTFLRKAAGLSPVAISLVSEILHKNPKHEANPEALAELIKSLPLTLTAPFSIDRAISSAGGIMTDAFDQNFMLRNKEGVFVAGEMLDWEAPTGGYLLQATFSTAVAAANGLLRWLEKHPADN